MKNWAFGIISVSISLLFSLAILEIFVRATETDGNNFDIEMWRYAKDLKRISSTPGVGHEHIPGKSGIYMGVKVTINSAGWRDPERPLKKRQDVTRIMMLGDSLTFGWGAKHDEVTSYHLEKHLNQNQQRKRYEVFNTGVGNTNTAMQAAYFINKGYIYNPDIVVLNYFINDAEVTPERKQNPLIERLYSAVFIAARYDALMRRFFGKSDWKKYYQELYLGESGWPNTKEAIKKLSSHCKTNNIKLILVNYPELHELSPYPFQRITNLLEAEAKALGHPFLDLLSSVANQNPRSLWVTEEDAHPNGIAARLYAAEIGDFIKKEYPHLP